MSKEMWLIVLGLLTVVTPYTGFPGSWKTILFVVIGVAVAIIGFLLRGEALTRGDARPHDHFVESTPAAPEPHEASTFSPSN